LSCDPPPGGRVLPDEVTGPAPRTARSLDILVTLAGLDPEGTDLPAELQPERADVAWLIADTFGPISHFDLGREKFPFEFAELQWVSGFEKPDEVFEAIARLDHPDAGAVLAMIGKHATDKTTAKAARRAAYKASIRRPALAPIFTETL
jgi:hypothetical protein